MKFAERIKDVLSGGVGSALRDDTHYTLSIDFRLRPCGFGCADSANKTRSGG